MHEKRDLHQVLKNLVHTARILPDHEGRMTVVLDLRTYMKIEDYIRGAERKEEPDHARVREDFILGTAVS